MKRTSIFFLCIALITVSASAASFGSDEQALRALERDHALATYMPNLDWFRAHLTDDYVLITTSGAVKTKADIIAQLSKDTNTKMEPYEPADVEIHAHGSTALITARLVRHYPDGKERVTAELRYLGVWIKTEEGWMNISGQESTISTKREPLK